MKNFFVTVTAFAIIFLISDCGGRRYPLILSSMKSEITSLGAYCKQNNIVNENTKKADILADSSDIYLSDGKNLKSLDMLRAAEPLYKTAILAEKLKKKQKELDNLKDMVKKDEEKLSEEKQILEELRIMRGEHEN